MTRLLRTVGAATLAVAITQAPPQDARAAGAAEISSTARQALRDLYASTPAARTLGDRARGILVFPAILKGGFIFGAEFGDGALFRGGRTAAYYRTVGGSYGFQAGIQTYGYALFFMDEAALKYLDESQGFEVGAGPSLVVVDAGFAAKMSTTTARSDVYAFFFNQQGLMGGVGLQGTKITRIHPE